MKGAYAAAPHEYGGGGDTALDPLFSQGMGRLRRRRFDQTGYERKPLPSPPH